MHTTSRSPPPRGLSPPGRIDGDSARSTWAIHIHGLGSVRAGTLRGTLAATERGYTSLVVSYRADGEGPAVGNARLHRGRRRRCRYRVRDAARSPTGRAGRMVDGCGHRAPARSPPVMSTKHRRSGTRLTCARLDRSHQSELHLQRSPRSRGKPRDSVANAPPAGPHGRPARARPTPILQLDRSCRGSHRAHGHPSRHPRRLRADTALLHSEILGLTLFRWRSSRSDTPFLGTPTPMAECGDRLARRARPVLDIKASVGDDLGGFKQASNVAAHR